MSFLYPAWLWGLLALLIPVIVHLFNFRKTRRVYFSNTRFIKKVQEASRSRRKLKHYLVLLSRMLFIFWLIMAFAQPFIPASKGALTQERVYFYLDNSYSMSRQVGEGQTALNEGIEYIEQLIDVYPAGTDFYLLTNNFAPYSHAPHSGPQLSELLTEIKFSGVVRTMNEITGRWDNQQVINGDGDFYYISDLQKSTAGIQQLDQSDSAFNIKLLTLNTTQKSNIYIDTVYLDNPFLIGRERVRLHVVINNDSDKAASELPVAVYLDDVQAGSTTSEIAAGASETIAFDLMVNAKTSSEGRISIEEYPVTFDNELFFVLDLGEKINVVEVNGKSAVSPVARVYGNEDLFNFKSFGYSNFDYNVLSGSDLVILNNINIIDGSLAAAIQDYTRAGGNVLLIPGASPDISSYQNIYGGLSGTDTTFLEQLMVPDFNNPFFEQVFEEKNPAVAMPQVASVIRWNGGRDILKTADGEPVLSEINEQLFLMSAPLQDEFSQLHKHALFVPLMYKMAALSSKHERSLYHYMDERLLVFSMDSVRSEDVYKLVKEEAEIIPEQRFVNRNLQLQLPSFLLNTGYYTLKNEEESLETIAININKSESDLETISEADLNQLKRIFPALTIYNADNAQDFRKTIEEEYVGSMLWKYCLILAILFLITEILIIRFLP